MSTATSFATGFTHDSFENMITGPGFVAVDYGLPTQVLLGVTDGGNEFNPGITYRDITGDFRFSMVKGGRILDDVQPSITTNLKSFKAENMPLLFPGMTATERTDISAAALTYITGEEAGTGDGTVRIFELANESVRLGTAEVAIDGTVVDTNQYVIYNVGEAGNAGGTAAEIHFFVAPATDEEVTISYVTNPAVTVPTHTEFTLGNVNEGSYFRNVTLVSTVLGSSQKFIAQIYNAIVSEPPTFSMSNKEETTSPVTFTGMVNPADMEALALEEKDVSEVIPFRIYYPNTAL